MAISKITSAGVDPNSIATNGTNGAIDVNASAPADSLAIDASGNVGIGTSSPTRLLDVSNTTGDTSIAITSSNTGQSSLWLARANDQNRGGIYYEHSNEAMGFRVNDTERMRIDSSGRVTMPYQPAFTAAGTGGSVSSSTSEIPFDNIILNRGSHYSSATGRFTAPIDGVYHFVAEVDAGSSTSAIAVKMKVNGTTKVNVWTNGTDGGSTGSMTVQLNANDYVSIGSDVGYEGGLCHFTGFLLG